MAGKKGRSSIIQNITWKDIISYIWFPISIILDAADFINIFEEIGVLTIKWHNYLQTLLNTVAELRDFILLPLTAPLNFIFGITLTEWYRAYIFIGCIIYSYRHFIFIFYERKMPKFPYPYNRFDRRQMSWKRLVLNTIVLILFSWPLVTLLILIEKKLYANLYYYFLKVYSAVLLRSKDKKAGQTRGDFRAYYKIINDKFEEFTSNSENHTIKKTNNDLYKSLKKGRKLFLIMIVSTLLVILLFVSINYYMSLSLDI